MKQSIRILSVLLLTCLVFSGTVYPWGSAGGDGSRADSIREAAIFFNNSGGALVAGDIVVLDLTGTGVTAGTTSGAYVTTTTTADATHVVGVCQDAALDQQSVRVITRGAALTNVLGLTDPVSTGSLVGTSTTAGFGGQHGSAKGVATGSVGIALDSTSGADAVDTAQIWVFVNPE